MPQYKQSFLERLTGTMHTDEGEEINNSLPQDESNEQWEEGEYADNAPDPQYTEDEREPQEENPEEDIGQLGIDMYESDNEIIIQSMIAGVTPENLNITIARDMVSIYGKRLAPSGLSDEQYIERELYWGEFARTIHLPFEIDTDNAEAVEKYGLLVIRLPKIDTSKTQQLRVKSI